MSIDLDRRFGGVARLYGNEGASRLRQAHACIVGIGGVGSWAAEAMARNGIGEITLIDLDMVAESNTNRQIHALGEIYGKAKVDAMAERIRSINPDCIVHCIEDFVTPDNVDQMLDRGYSVVIDAIDQVKAKAAMIAFCRRHKLPIIVAGAAGGQLDPTQIRIEDLSKTVQDPLLARLRSILRREYGFAKDGKKNSASPQCSPPSRCATRRRMPVAIPSADQRASTVPDSVRRFALLPSLAWLRLLMHSTCWREVQTEFAADSLPRSIGHSGSAFQTV